MEKINNQNQIGQFIVNYNQQMKDILDQSQKQIGSMLQQMDYTKVINKLIETVDEVIEDNAKLKRYVIENQEKNKELERKLDETKDNLDNMNNKYSVLYDATYVIATDDGKRIEMKNKNNSLAYKYCQGKNSIMDKLFHQKIVKSCYSHLFGIFGVNAYTRIKIDDYDLAMKAIDHWYMNTCNVEKAVNKKVNELSKNIGIKDKNGNYIVKKEREALFNIYMEMTDGNQKPFVNKEVKKTK